MKESQVILSIETGILGGSLALFRNGLEIGYWIGKEQISKAENVLEQISKQLEKNNITKETIDLITISSGPGSVTGIRIGESLGRGLRKALSRSLITVSVLDAMAASGESRSKFISAVPVGRNQICWQFYDYSDTKKISGYGEANLSTPEIFFEGLKSKDGIILILHQYLYEKYKGVLTNREYARVLKIVTIKNLARAIGRIGLLKTSTGLLVEDHSN